MIDTIFIGRPPVVTSNWKFTTHTRSGASATTVGGGREEGLRVPQRASATPRYLHRHRRWIFL
ncbi:hypothetical protein A5727_10865 [Mycobacterium sp. ACS4331]|nr:hypothetical protein A5727_10865 [Mycobacterium sp. ACS4331]